MRSARFPFLAAALVFSGTIFSPLPAALQGTTSEGTVWRALGQHGELLLPPQSPKSAGMPCQSRGQTPRCFSIPSGAAPAPYLMLRLLIWCSGSVRTGPRWLTAASAQELLFRLDPANPGKRCLVSGRAAFSWEALGELCVGQRDFRGTKPRLGSERSVRRHSLPSSKRQHPALAAEKSTSESLRKIKHGRNSAFQTRIDSHTVVSAPKKKKKNRNLVLKKKAPLFTEMLSNCFFFLFCTFTAASWGANNVNKLLLKS